MKVGATLFVDGEKEIHNSHLSIFSSSPPPLLEPVGDIMYHSSYILQMSHAGTHCGHVSTTLSQSTVVLCI